MELILFSVCPIEPLTSHIYNMVLSPANLVIIEYFNTYIVNDWQFQVFFFFF